MELRISQSDGLPIYVQIVKQVKYLIASGRLLPEEEIPPIRVLAHQLLVNPNTVARAYRELAAAGLVVKRHGAGTYGRPSGDIRTGWADSSSNCGSCTAGQYTSVRCRHGYTHSGDLDAYITNCRTKIDTDTRADS